MRIKQVVAALSLVMVAATAAHAAGAKPTVGVIEFKNESGAGWWSGGVGWELSGMLSALIGAGMGFVFLGLTAASILLADRVTGSDLLSPAYFGIVIGSWMLKFIVFLVLIFTLRDVDFIEPTVLFVCLVAAVIGGLVTDIIAVTRSRVPYVDVTLPSKDEIPDL